MTTLKFSSRKVLATLFVSLLPVVGFASVPATAQSGASPTGENVGFRFIQTPIDDENLSTHGAFMMSDGVGLDLCGQGSGGPEGNCGFEFRYSIDSAQYAPMVQASPFSYETWPTIDNTNSEDVLCMSGGGVNGPYTNFNCFNENTYGQTFKPAASGVLSDFSMAMTCQAPSGSTSLVAALFESTTPVGADAPNADAALIGTPLATANFTMSDCDTSWSGKVFTDADFSFPVMDFGPISLESTKWYTVVFAGDAVAGTLPSGVTDPETTQAPGIPGMPVATAGNGQATVQITAPTSGGSPTSYTVTASPGGATCSINAPATSCTVTGLTNGTAYTFSSTATNAGGTSAASASSYSVTPSSAELANTGANTESLFIAGLLAAIAGLGLLALNQRKRVW